MLSMSMENLLSSSGVDARTGGARISAADVEVWAGSQFSIPRLATDVLRLRAVAVLGEGVNRDKPVFGAAMVALSSSIWEMMDKGNVPSSTIRDKYMELKTSLKVHKKKGLLWSSYSTWMVDDTGFFPPDGVEKPHLGALNKASDHYAIDTVAGRGTSWDTDINKGFEHASGLFCIDKSEDPLRDLESARLGIYQKFNANTSAESTLVREQRMRVAERVKAAKIQGQSKEMSPAVTALIKHVEQNMASELANHETCLKKTEEHPFFLRLNDHRKGIPVRTQGIKNITRSKIDMTAGMVDGWMGALLTNKRFMDDFDEIFKPFPGEVPCADWLRKTKTSLSECRKATGPVDMTDVMRAGTFELLATLMSNAVLTPPLSEGTEREAAEIDEVGLSGKEDAGENATRCSGRNRKRTASFPPCVGKQTGKRRCRRSKKGVQTSASVEVSGWASDPEFERLLVLVKQAKGADKLGAALKALNVAVGAQDVGLQASRIVACMEVVEVTVPEGQVEGGEEGRGATSGQVAMETSVSTNGGSGPQGDGGSTVLAAKAAAHFFRRCISLGCVDYDVKASFAWHARTKGGLLDLEQGTFATANFLQNDRFQVGMVDGWKKKEFGVFAKTGFTMSQTMVPEFESKMMLQTLSLDLEKMKQASITKEYVMDAMSGVELGGMRSAIERNGVLHVALGGSLGHFVNSDNGACKGAIFTAQTPDTQLCSGRTAANVEVKMRQDLLDLIAKHEWLANVVVDGALDGSSCFCCPLYVRPFFGERFVKGEQFYIKYDLPGPVLQDMSFDGGLFENELRIQGYRRPNGEDWPDTQVTAGVCNVAKVTFNEFLEKEFARLLKYWEAWLMEAACRKKRADRKDVRQVSSFLQRREGRLLSKLRPNNEFPGMPLQKMGLGVWTTPQDGYCLYRNIGLLTGQSVDQVLETCVAFTEKECDPDGKPHHSQYNGFVEVLKLDNDMVTNANKLFKVHRTHCRTPGEDSKHLPKSLEHPDTVVFRIFSCLGKRWLLAIVVKQDPTRTAEAVGRSSFYVNGSGSLFDEGVERDVGVEEMSDFALGKDFDHGVLFDGEHYDTLVHTSDITRPPSQIQFDIEEVKGFKKHMVQCMGIGDDGAVVVPSELPPTFEMGDYHGQNHEVGYEAGDTSHDGVAKQTQAQANREGVREEAAAEAAKRVSERLTSDELFARQLQEVANREGAREKAATEAARKDLASKDPARKVVAGASGARVRRRTTKLGVGQGRGRSKM